MKYKGTLKEKFIKLFGKLEFTKEIEVSENYVEFEKCDYNAENDEFGCIYDLIGDGCCDSDNHYHIEKKIIKKPISKQISDFVIVRNTRFKKLFVAELVDNDKNQRWFNDWYKNRFVTVIDLSKFDKNMTYKGNLYNGYFSEPVAKIEEISEILRNLEIHQIEELLKTSTIKEILKIVEVRKFEKQLIDDVKYLPTSKKSIIKF